MWDVPVELAAGVRESDPQQQGLKPSEDQHRSCVLSFVRESDPQQQGLKHHDPRDLILASPGP